MTTRFPQSDDTPTLNELFAMWPKVPVVQVVQDHIGPKPFKMVHADDCVCESCTMDQLNNQDTNAG